MKFNNKLQEILKKHSELKLLFALTIIILILVISILFFPYFLINKTINDHYRSQGESEFISNYEVVKDENFSFENHILNLNPFNLKVATFYKGSDYRNYSQVSITDFYYLKRDKLILWKVERYESSFVPYIEDEDFSYDDSYNQMKENVISGEVSKGLTPEEEFALLSKQDVNATSEGDLVDFVQSNDEAITIEVLAGSQYGSNYIDLDGLRIENFVSGNISTDNKYFIYSTGRYFEPLGEIIPELDIRVYDIENKTDKEIYNSDIFPNIFEFYSDGKNILVSTRDRIFKIDMNGENFKTITEYPIQNRENEEFEIAEIVEVNGNTIKYLLPNNINFDIDLSNL